MSLMGPLSDISKWHRHHEDDDEPNLTREQRLLSAGRWPNFSSIRRKRW
jgi:hypothetical protein